MIKYSEPKAIKVKLSSFRWVLLGFMTLILLGTLLLMLPISSANHIKTPFLDALFTATSASCVTGLIVKDTATYWSNFGKIIILIMIQIGGLGVITMTLALVKLSGRKISLYQRSITQESLSANHGGGIFKMVAFIFKITIIFELIGAILLSIPFIQDFGLIEGIIKAIFHSISAFCNAGFDIMGNFSSLTNYVSNPIVNITIMMLIICGGLGFYTWEDIKKHKFKFVKYTLQSKIIIFTSFILIILPAIYFFLHEYYKLPLLERSFASLFQSITTRTAGFNTTDQAELSDSGLLISIMLMLIGGSPGSTAGGLKTTTIAVLIISSLSVFRQNDEAHAFSRRIEDSTVKAAASIFLLYVILFAFSAIIISGIENLPLIDCLFETASAIGTVGLTTGITPDLQDITRIIIIFLMFFGRVGCLTLIYAALPRNTRNSSRFPLDHINVG